MHRLKPISGLICFVLVIALGVWWLSARQPAPHAAHQRKAAARAATFEAITEAAPAAPLIGSFEANRAEAESVFMAAATGAEEGPDAQVRASLARSLANHVAARASGDASAYLAVVDTEPSAWLPPDDERGWAIIEALAEYRLDEPVDRSKPREALEKLFTVSQSGGLWRLTKLGKGPDGCVVKFARIRSVESRDPALWLGDDAHEFWLSGPTSVPLRFRSPAVSLEEVIRRDGAATVARVCFIAETVRRVRTKIWTEWHYDPEARQWHCNTMLNRGAGWYVTMF